MNRHRRIAIWIILIVCMASAPACLAKPKPSLNRQLLDAASGVDAIAITAGRDYIYLDNPLATVKALVVKGADVNARDAEGRTPLMKSAYGTETEIGTVLSMPDVAEWLLSKGAKVNLEDKQGQTALLLAAKTDGGPQEGEEGATDIVKMLIGRGADVDHRDRQGHTALFWARHRHHRAMARLLRKAGAKG